MKHTQTLTRKSQTMSRKYSARVALGQWYLEELGLCGADLSAGSLPCSLGHGGSTMLPYTFRVPPLFFFYFFLFFFYDQRSSCKVKLSTELSLQTQ